MDLSGDADSIFNANLNKLVKETYDQTYQDEVQMYTKILAYYCTQQQASTSNVHKIKRYTNIPNKSNGSICKNCSLINENTKKNPAEFKEPINKKIISKRYSQSMHKIGFYNKEGTQKLGVCSKSAGQSYSNMTQGVNMTTSVSEPKYVEKMTYCRPVLNLYNQQYMYKTMERNNRLQQLVRQVVETRAREKNEEAWNNYINDLRNKYRYQAEVDKLHNNHPEDTNSDIIDSYNTNLTLKQSNPCQNLLKDFYRAFNDHNNVNDCNNRQPRRYDLPNYKHYNFRNEGHCYPTTSQGLLMMRSNQRRIYQPPRHKGNNVVVETDNNPYMRRLQTKRNIDNQKRKFPSQKSIAVQTDSDSEIKVNERQGTLKEKFNSIQINMERLKQKLMRSSSEKVSLSNIGNKLDTLIESVNTYISEIKTQRISINTTERATGSSFHNALANQSIETEKVSKSYLKKDVVCGVVQENSLPSYGFFPQDSIDKILYEEMNKSDKVKRDIEQLLHNPSNLSPVKIMFEIPTKERSTEVTDSISNNAQIPQITAENKTSTLDSDRMTIAVNTEPLGILALIRVSTETVKRLLSYMPQIDYCSYLSKLQCQLAQRPQITMYDCNICGASFNRPSLLSDHITQQHNLGTTRDCCVCRHVMQVKHGIPKLFGCRHCGQRFTRAYCRELHEEECGRKMGIRHDVSPSLMILS